MFLDVLDAVLLIKNELNKVNCSFTAGLLRTFNILTQMLTPEEHTVWNSLTAINMSQKSVWLALILAIIPSKSGMQKVNQTPGIVS